MDTENRTLGIVLDNLTLYDAGEDRKRTLSDFIHEEGFVAGKNMDINEMFALVFNRRRNEKLRFSRGEKVQLLFLAWKVSIKRQERLKKALSKALRDNTNLRQLDMFYTYNDE
jgi:hypothetical protein